MDTLILISLAAIVIVAVTSLVGVIIYRKLRENESLKYEFITIIAHKFRTPLTQIKWTTEGLITEEQDQYKKQQLDDLRKSNENLIKLTGTLVELTDAAGKGHSTYNFEVLNLCDLARSIMETSKTAFHEKNLFMSLTSVQPEVMVKADRPRLDFVIGTLMENACSYTPPGRNISVDITVNKRKAILSVTDNGIGIDPHNLSHMFSKFYRTKDAQSMDTEGLGVGLFLAQSVMKRHGGSIQAYSEGVGKGSTFSLILPLAN
ncbi:MAG: Sensor protein [Candidatus Parcubacteria bacterium]|nr:Sensor protein [Candidatus Parcubacteria bacterium]